MFCTKCGKAVEENAKFCPNCGATLDGRGVPPEEQASVPDGQTVMSAVNAPVGSIPAEADVSVSTESARKQKSRKRSIIIAAIAILVIVLVVALFSSNEVNLVKSGTLTQYPEQTIEDAFNAFFDKPEWSSYEQEGETYVKFTGKCTLYGEVVNAKIIFLINGNEFQIDSVKIGDLNITNTYDLESIFDKIYSE